MVDERLREYWQAREKQEQEDFKLKRAVRERQEQALKNNIDREGAIICEELGSFSVQMRNEYRILENHIFSDSVVKIEACICRHAGIDPRSIHHSETYSVKIESGGGVVFDYNHRHKGPQWVGVFRYIPGEEWECHLSNLFRKADQKRTYRLYPDLANKKIEDISTREGRKEEERKRLRDRFGL